MLKSFVLENDEFGDLKRAMHFVFNDFPVSGAFGTRPGQNGIDKRGDAGRKERAT